MSLSIETCFYCSHLLKITLCLSYSFHLPLHFSPSLSAKFLQGHTCAYVLPPIWLLHSLLNPSRLDSHLQHVTKTFPVKIPMTSTLVYAVFTSVSSIWHYPSIFPPWNTFFTWFLGYHNELVLPTSLQYLTAPFQFPPHLWPFNVEIQDSILNLVSFPSSIYTHLLMILWL